MEKHSASSVGFSSCLLVVKNRTGFIFEGSLSIVGKGSFSFIAGKKEGEELNFYELEEVL